jgi:hypothetical protein
MIALVIIPLVWADPQSRKVLVPDESKPSERFAGEDSEGFYSVTQAVRHWEAINLMEMPHYWMTRHCSEVSPSDLPLYNMASLEDGALVAVYVEHFSAPTDADNHFEDAPLLTLPDVAEEAQEPAYDPETHKWSVGDWFMVTIGEDHHFGGDHDFIADYGRGPFCVGDIRHWSTKSLYSKPVGRWTDGTFWYFNEIRPCPAPSTEGASPQVS